MKILLNLWNKIVEMATDHTKSQNFLNWVQIVAIFVGGVWVVWVFVLKDYNNANITIEIKLKKAGEKEKFIAVEADIIAINKSQRSLYLMSSPFVLRGIRNTFEIEVPDSIKRIQGHITKKIAEGNLYRDEFIQSNETLHTSQIFYIEKNSFDHIELETFLFSSTCVLSSNERSVITMLSTSKCDEDYFIQWKVLNDVNATFFYEFMSNDQKLLASEKTEALLKGNIFDLFISTGKLSLWENPNSIP